MIAKRKQVVISQKEAGSKKQRRKATKENKVTIDTMVRNGDYLTKK